MDDKDRDEARKEAFEFVEIIYKSIVSNLDYSPTWKVLERDARIRAEAVVVERERWKPVLEALKRVLHDKMPGYHDCIDDGEPECAWCEADRALEAILSDDKEAHRG